MIKINFNSVCDFEYLFEAARKAADVADYAVLQPTAKEVRVKEMRPDSTGEHEETVTYRTLVLKAYAKSGVMLQLLVPANIMEEDGNVPKVNAKEFFAVLNSANVYHELDRTSGIVLETVEDGIVLTVGRSRSFCPYISDALPPALAFRAAEKDADGKVTRPAEIPLQLDVNRSDLLALLSAVGGFGAMSNGKTFPGVLLTVKANEKNTGAVLDVRSYCSSSMGNGALSCKVSKGEEGFLTSVKNEKGGEVQIPSKCRTVLIASADLMKYINLTDGDTVRLTLGETVYAIRDTTVCALAPFINGNLECKDFSKFPRRPEQCSFSVLLDREPLEKLFSTIEKKQSFSKVREKLPICLSFDKENMAVVLSGFDEQTRGVIPARFNKEPGSEIYFAADVFRRGMASCKDAVRICIGVTYAKDAAIFVFIPFGEDENGKAVGLPFVSWAMSINSSYGKSAYLAARGKKTEDSENSKDESPEEDSQEEE